MSTEYREVVIITGGASGIGFVTAQQAAARGASVAIFDVSPEAASKAVESLEGGPHLAVPVNVTDRAAVEAAVAQVVAELGKPTGVVTAAGIVSRTRLHEVSAEEFRMVLAVNVEGVQNTIAASAPHLIEVGQGASIVILGSVAANTGGGLMGSGVYATSKAAVIGIARGYARELAPFGIRANVVSPAATDTPMTRALSEEERQRIASMSLIGRLSDPSEIASTVSFLLGTGASSITGQVIQPNGGVYFN